MCNNQFRFGWITGVTCVIIPLEIPWYCVWRNRIGFIQSVWKAQSRTYWKHQTIASTVASVKANTLTPEDYWMKWKTGWTTSAQEEEIATNQRRVQPVETAAGFWRELKQSNHELKQNTRIGASEWSPGANTKRHWVWRQKELEWTSEIQIEFLANMSTWIADPAQQCADSGRCYLKIKGIILMILNMPM